jgi:hypothetical protein
MFIVVEWLNDLICLAYTCLNIMHQTLTFAIKYYGQTHKLCNALEKLLLVTSPSSAFGGVTGGDTSQNRREVSTVPVDGTSMNGSVHVYFC